MEGSSRFADERKIAFFLEKKLRKKSILFPSPVWQTSERLRSEVLLNGERAGTASSPCVRALTRAPGEVHTVRACP